MPVLTTRVYREGDAAALLDIFQQSVRVAGLRDYSAEQVAVWAAQRTDSNRFDVKARDGRLVLIAVDAQDRPIAYCDLEPDGHIDDLYCSPAAVGTGLASMLYDRLEGIARERGMTRLFVEASEAAKRLFDRKNFVVVKRRDFILVGVAIHNYAMAKDLA